MAALPCEACQESMTVIPTGTDTVTSDSAGRTVFMRYRTCTTPGCEMYLIRRTTYEVAAPVAEPLCVLSPELSNLRKLGLPPRSIPLPCFSSTAGKAG